MPRHATPRRDVHSPTSRLSSGKRNTHPTPPTPPTTPTYHRNPTPAPGHHHSAIGVLEGIALVGNPSFAIVDEAYPFISKRLLTDDSPRLRAALRYMIYGKEEVFDVDRLIDLLQVGWLAPWPIDDGLA